MKKLMKLSAMAAIALVALVSCTKDNTSERTILDVAQYENVTIVADINGVDTKTTYLESNGMMKVGWSANDTISVFVFALMNDYTYTIDLETQKYVKSAKKSDFYALINVANCATETEDGSRFANFVGQLPKYSSSQMKQYGIKKIVYSAVYPHINASYKDSYENQYILHNSEFNEYSGFTCILGGGRYTDDFADYFIECTDFADPLASLRHFDLMTGALSQGENGTLVTHLQHRNTLVKYDLTFDDEAFEAAKGMTLSQFGVNWPGSHNGYTFVVNEDGSMAWAATDQLNDPSGIAYTDLHITLPVSDYVIDSKNLVFYSYVPGGIAIAPEKEADEDEAFIMLFGYDGSDENSEDVCLGMATHYFFVGEQLVAEPGKMLTVKATLSPEEEE